MCSPQKVVIPKGLVNPRETTIIEIPRTLQNVGTVVARPRPIPYDVDNPPVQNTPPMYKKRLYTRKTYPPRKAAGFGGMDDAGLTYGGIPNDESVNLSPPHFKPWYPISPRECYGDISSGDVSYAVYQPGKTGFDPPLLTSSSFKEIDDPRETSLYRDFKPGKISSRASSPARTPGSMKHWHSSLGTVSPDPQSAYYDSSYMSDSPCESSEQTSHERSYYDSSGDANVDYDSNCPCDEGDGSSGGYKKFDSIGSPGSPGGGYQRFDSPGASPRSLNQSSASSGSPCPASGSSKKITQRDMMNSLGDLEASELSQIMGDLNQFQHARRQLVFDASSLASAADVSSNLLNTS